jgi:hypothetical protein
VGCVVDVGCLGEREAERTSAGWAVPVCQPLQFSSLLFSPAPSFQKVTIRVEYGCSATLQIIGQRRDGMACNDWRVARHNKRLRRRRPATPFSKTTWLALPKLANSSIQNPNSNDGKQLKLLKFAPKSRHRQCKGHSEMKTAMF